MKRPLPLFLLKISVLGVYYRQLWKIHNLA